jgi:hypothetical protein
MAKYPWRFQADIPVGETDPLVTVFMGPVRVVTDDDGNPTEEFFIEPDTSEPVQLRLSALGSALADGTLDQMRKDAKKKAEPPSPGAQ